MLWQWLKVQNILTQAATLAVQVKGQQSMRGLQHEYKILDNAILEAKKVAKWNCHKLKMGWVPWCLQLARATNRILYWKGVAARQADHCIGTKILWRQAKKAGIHHDLQNVHLPADQILANLKTAYCMYQHLKQDLDRQDTWLGQWQQAQAKTSTPKQQWCQICTMEQIWTTA